MSGKAVVRADRNTLPTAITLGAGEWRGTLVAVTIAASRADQIMGATQEIFIRGLAANRKQQIVSFGSPPMGAEVVVIRPTAVGLIEDKLEARRIRDNVLLPVLEKGGAIGIDLRAGQLVTHSFVHALLFAAVREAGPSVRRRIFVHCSSPQVRNTVRLVAWMAVNDSQDGGLIEVDDLSP